MEWTACTPARQHKARVAAAAFSFSPNIGEDFVFVRELELTNRNHLHLVVFLPPEVL
jgi:hypothetical protein